jgi:hypothetical protein
MLEVVAQLASHGVTQSLVTFGVEKFQREKWERLTGFHPHFTDQSFVVPGAFKGEVLADRVAEFDGDAYFVDDSVTWLRDALLKAPSVRRIRAVWVTGYTPHSGDGTLWFVAHTPEQALAHILAA